MRTMALLLVALLVSGAPLFARERTHELSVGAGVATVPDLLEAFISAAPAFFPPLFLVREESEWVTPALCLHYRYHVTGLVSVGGTFNYQRFERTFYFVDEMRSTSDINYYTFMGRVDFTYLRRRLFRMYSGAGVGLSIMKESGEDVDDSGETFFAFQLNAVGLRVGKELAAYLELGFGFNGIIAAGATYEF